MKLRVIAHYLSLIAIGTGIAMLVPLIVSLVNNGSDTGAFALSSAIALGTGILVWLVTPSKDRRLSTREAIVIVAGGWIVASAAGSLPYFFSGALPQFVDAFFEAVSGFTTTGATVFTSIETQEQGILLWRSMTQWLGGMGIIMLFVALFPVLGMGSAHLIEAEMPGSQHYGERLTARIRDSAKALWLIYLGMTIAQYILLRFAGLIPFDAITVTFSTIPIGGFTPTDLSIAAYNSLWVEIIVIVFMVMAGVNFGLYFFLFFKKQPLRLFNNSELRLYIAILLFSATIISINLFSHMGFSIGEAIRYGAFQVASIGTTTGFSTTDFDLWPTFSKAILLILMVIGGCAGSTAGALKVIRFLVLAKYIHRRLLMVFKPNTIISIKVNGMVLPENVISRIISLTLLYAVLAAGGFMIMSGIGLDPITALSSVIATIGNVGPGFGMVGAAENYAFIPPIGKGVLALLMLAGRLEIFTILVLFMPSFWRWR